MLFCSHFYCFSLTEYYYVSVYTTMLSATITKTVDRKDTYYNKFYPYTLIHSNSVFFLWALYIFLFILCKLVPFFFHRFGIVLKYIFTVIWNLLMYSTNNYIVMHFILYEYIREQPSTNRIIIFVFHDKIYNQIFL